MSPRVCNCLKCAKNKERAGYSGIPGCPHWLNNGKPSVILNCRDWESLEPKAVKKVSR